MIFGPQAKLLWHGDRVLKWLKTGRTNPVLFEVAPCGYCNASCPWCFFNGKKTRNEIDPEVMLTAIDDMARLGVRAINWSGGGEPTLHHNFAEFVERASIRGIKQGLFTNGYTKIPFQAKFDWIRISLTDKGFKKIRKPAVPFGICLNHIPQYTDKELIEICLDARDFGASYLQVRPALIGDHKTQPKLKAPNHLLRLSRRGFKVYVTDYKYREAVLPKKYKYCYGYYFCTSIDWFGHVSSCLYLTLNPEFQFGDLNDLRLIDMWPDIKQKVPVQDTCQNCCKNHEINGLLYAARRAEAVDFI